MSKIMIVVLSTLMLISCRTITKVQEVPVEVVKKEYIYNTKIDSIIIKDSIDRWHSGDTLYIYKEHTKYKLLVKHDTITRVDSIPKVVTVKEIEKVEVNHLYWWQKVLMYLGVAALLWIITYLMRNIKIGNGH